MTTSCMVAFFAMMRPGGNTRKVQSFVAKFQSLTVTMMATAQRLSKEGNISCLLVDDVGINNNKLISQQ